MASEAVHSSGTCLGHNCFPEVIKVWLCFVSKWALVRLWTGDNPFSCWHLLDAFFAGRGDRWKKRVCTMNRAFWSSFLQNELDLCFSLGWVHWGSDCVFSVSWCKLQPSHYKRRRKRPLFYFYSWLLGSGVQGHLFHFSFYEGTKENGTNLVLGNCFFSLCLGREVATLLLFSRLRTFLLFLVLEMLWRKL